MFDRSRRAIIAGAAMLAVAGAVIGSAAAQAATPPSIVGLVGPALRAGTSASFKITTSLPKGATITCRLDGGAAASCGGTKIYTNLANGKHTLSVKAVSGKTIQTGTATVTVDTLAPKVPKIANQSGGWTNTDMTVIATQVSDVGLAGGVTYQYRSTEGIKGNSSTKPCAVYGSAKPMTGRTVDISVAGVTCVEFRAKDAVGNTSAWSGYYKVLIDRLAPSKAAITGADSAWHKTITLTARATDTGGSAIGYYQWYSRKDDGITWTALNIAWGKSTMTFAATGNYQVKAVAFDAAGNQGAESSVVTVNIDKTAPTAPVLPDPTTDWYTNVNAYYPAGSTDAGSGVDHYVCYDDTTLLGTTDPSGKLILKDGAYYAFQCQAVDKMGNVSRFSNMETVMIDTTPPKIHGDGDMGTATTNQDVTLFVPDATDTRSGVDHIDCQESEDGGVTWEDWWIGCDGYGLTFNADGHFAMRYRAVDQAGNVSALSNVVHVNILGHA